MEGEDLKGEHIVRHATDDEKFSALAFKLMNDPYVGQLTFSGCILVLSSLAIR